MTDSVIQEQLLLLLRDPGWIENMDEVIIDKVFTLAAKQHVDCYLYFRIKEAGCDQYFSQEMAKQLGEKFKRQTMRNLSLFGQLQKIAKTLYAEGIPLIALKGLQTALTLHPNIATRYLRDMDILIPAEKAQEAYTLTSQMGYIGEKKLTEFDYTFEYSKHLPQQHNETAKTMLEVHGYIEKDQQGSFNELSENAFYAQDREDTYLFLAPDELLIHLCSHIAYADLYKIDLRHYLDIYLLLISTEYTIDWESVIEKAKLRGKTKGIYTVIKLTCDFFQLSVPKILLQLSQNNEEEITVLKVAQEFLWEYDKKSPLYYEYRRTFRLRVDRSVIWTIVNRIFIPKNELAYKYDLDPSSRKIYLYYLTRFIDLMRKQSQRTLETRFKNTAKTFNNKTHFINDYLSR